MATAVIKTRPLFSRSAYCYRLSRFCSKYDQPQSFLSKIKIPAPGSLLSRCLTTDRSVSIGDIHVEEAPLGSGRPDLVPLLSDSYLSASQVSPSVLEHLRWMLQKDLCLKQDFLLLGPEALARDRRRTLLTYAALLGREVEYLAITRDTSDADLKQRKEVLYENGMSTTTYINQAPVRAALHGRLLILDGLEKAERNVLPTLNNLLENRELSLEDSSMLVSSHVYDTLQKTDNNTNNEVHKIHRVHPDFRVAALGSLSETGDHSLDPPLRSRFQARVATPLDPGELLQVLNHSLTGQVDVEVLKELVKEASTAKRDMPLGAVEDAARYFCAFPSNTIDPLDALEAHGLGLLRVQNLQRSLTSTSHAPSSLSSGHFLETPTTHTLMNLALTALDKTSSRAVVYVGPKGCGKSALARHVARQHDKPQELFSLYPDMTARDLLLQRATDAVGNTIWNTTPLTRAVQQGTWVILDGIDKLSADTLSSMALMLEQGQLDLPDGTRLVAQPGFAALALAHPPSGDDKSWITPEVAGMFHWIEMEPLPSNELQVILSHLFPALPGDILDKIVQLREKLDEAITTGAADTLEEKESLVLSLRKMKHICRRAERKESTDLANIVHDALMTSLMPDREKRIVQASMTQCGISARKRKARKHQTSSIQLDENILTAYRRQPKHPLLVPNPRFQENPGHGRVLRDILEAHGVGERALLIMGYQGVGKNRVVDFLLSRLQCEREYLQLHRDTTVQSLLSSPSIDGGRLVYGDSPLVRAAKYGRILVLDEADKAPVEVVALLKGLIEDGELALPDGRVLRYAEGSESVEPAAHQVQIHPDFRVWALANPAGYPFHGNDLAKEMADVFSCHTVPPLDSDSQIHILKSYGPSVPDKLIATIISAWQELSQAHQKGILAYPFSIREAVSVVKHMETFPDDRLEGALENVIAFDRFDEALLKQLDAIFSPHGVSVGRARAATSRTSTSGGISTPRTRSDTPKHGQVDPDNTPHVGGNTWAGGTGGSDTAGLGGRGGPYRLDAGHPVHQVTDAMKAEVTEEAQRRAREMAKEALDEKLKELNMGKLDWERYNNLREQVAVQIQQLQVLLKDIKRRKEERVWLRRQAAGELDDSRLVDALAGEKDIFKRRGVAMASNQPSSLKDEPMSIKLVVDVSASMYRFNGYDGRLERLLEATLMIMDTLREDERFQLEIVGHNGTSAAIPLVAPNTPLDPAAQLLILETMVAQTQHTWAGDSTLEAIHKAMEGASESDLILIISDANLKRYRIEPEDVSALLRTKNVHAHLILIGSMGQEATELAKAIPNQRAQVCLESSELPLLIKNIVASAAR